jgi:hypothetical protein
MKIWRFAGFDDSFKIGRSLSDSRGSKAVIAGCVTAGTEPEGFMFGEIEIDGMDATEELTAILMRSKFKKQLKCVFLSGLTFGGFNTVNIRELYESTDIPVVVVMRKIPDFDRIREALKNVPESEKRWEAILSAGEIHRINELFVQCSGCGAKNAEKYIKSSTLKGNIPEPLRLAHMVASAIVHGESRGRV